MSKNYFMIGFVSLRQNESMWADLGLACWYPETEDEPAQLRLEHIQGDSNDADVVEEIVVRKYPGGRLEARRHLLREVKDTNRCGDELKFVMNAWRRQRSRFT